MSDLVAVGEAAGGTEEGVHLAARVEARPRGEVVVLLGRLGQVGAERHLPRRHVLVSRHLGRVERVALVPDAHELVAVVGVVALPEAGELVLRQEAAEDEELVAAARHASPYRSFRTCFAISSRSPIAITAGSFWRRAAVVTRSMAAVM